MTFQDAERQYAALLHQWRAQEISLDQFRERVKQLRLQTPDGSWWQLRGRDGQWLRWSGSAWIEATRPSDVPAPPQPEPLPARAAPLPQSPSVPGQGAEPGRRRGCLRSCILVALVLACLVGGLTVAGYFGMRSGRISPLQLQMQLSSTASVSVYNLADETVTVRLTQLDGSDGPSEWESERLEPFDSGSYGRIPTGRLEVAFATSGAPPSQTCTLQTSRGDAYLFVIVPEGIAVAEEGGNQSSSASLRVDRSELCQ